MEQADRHICFARILAVVLLLSPELSFARGMSGGGAGRGAGASFSSVGSRSARTSFSGSRAIALNPDSRAFIAARNVGSVNQATIVGARTIARSPFLPISANGHHADFRHRRIFINSLPAPIIVGPYPFGFYPYCNSIYFSAYDCPPPYSPFAPVYVPVPVPAYSNENPYDVENSVSLPTDNGYYVPSSNGRDSVPVSSESFDRQGDRAFRARDYMTALRDWQHAVVDDPTNGAVAMKLALAMFALGKYSEAAGTTQHALMLLPQEKWGEAFRDYKKLYGGPSDYSAQLKSLAKASADRPNDPALRFLLGFYYGYSDRVAEAMRELDKLVQLEPRDQLGRKLRDLIAAKTPKDGKSPTAVASNGIYMRKDSNGTIYFSNIPADLKNQPTAWQRTPY